MMRTALYIRVSTEHKQDTANQAGQLTAYASRQGWDVVVTYQERASGTTASRPAFQAMMADAARGAFDLVLFWSLDRFSREGVAKTLEYLNTLTRYAVKYRSLQEPMIDTTGPYGELVVSILAAFARLEAARIKERIRAGLERSRQQGKRPGPRPIVVDRARLAEARAAGASIRELARTFGMSPATVLRRLAETPAEPQVTIAPCTKSNIVASTASSGTTRTKPTTSS